MLARQVGATQQRLSSQAGAQTQHSNIVLPKSKIKQHGWEGHTALWGCVEGAHGRGALAKAENTQQEL